MIWFMVNQKILRDKASKIASNLKHDGYQNGLASMVYKFFDKRSSGVSFQMVFENKQNWNVLNA